MASIDMLESSGAEVSWPSRSGVPDKSKPIIIYLNLTLLRMLHHIPAHLRVAYGLSRVPAAYFLWYCGECGCPDALCQLDGVFGANDRELVLRTCMFRVVAPHSHVTLT